MHHSARLAVDFANTKIVDARSIWHLVGKHNLPLPESHLYRSEKEQTYFHNQITRIKHRSKYDQTVMDAEASHLCRHQPQYIGFLEDAVDGKIDIDFINTKHLIFMEENITSYGYDENAKDPFNPAPKIKATFETLEQIISFRSIVWPFWTGNGCIYSRIKRCQFCNSFYLFERDGGKFCTTKCKNAFARSKKK